MALNYLSGPIFKPLIKMAGASLFGMLTIFAVTLVDMFFISLLGDHTLLAAIGFSQSLLFVIGALGIGFSVATGVIVAQAYGRGGTHEAAYPHTALVLLALFISIILTALIYLCSDTLLTFVGALEDAKKASEIYFGIVVVSLPLSTLAMVYGSALRCVGDAKFLIKLSMYTALLNLILDPLFIFVLDGGLTGAAWATVVSRIVAFMLGSYVLFNKHHLLIRISFKELKRQIPNVLSIATPAILSNLSTPIGALMLTKAVAQYGTQAIAGTAVVGALMPILMSVYFSLTGAAGPIAGQNIGAGQFNRVGTLLLICAKTMIAYTFIIWVIFLLGHSLIIDSFSLEGVAIEVVNIYVKYQIPLTVGLGFMALSSVVFNQLGKPKWSAYTNVTRAIPYTLIAVLVGANWGLAGVLIASSFGFLLFGAIAWIFALRLYRAKSDELNRTLPKRILE